MKRAILVALALIVMTGCGSDQGVGDVAAPEPSESTVTPSPSPSPSPIPLTRSQRLDAVLEANSQIIADLCFKAEELRNVGWEEALLPSLLTIYLTNAQTEQLESVGGKLEKVIEDVLHRCAVT